MCKIRLRCVGWASAGVPKLYTVALKASSTAFASAAVSLFFSARPLWAQAAASLEPSSWTLAIKRSRRPAERSVSRVGVANRMGSDHQNASQILVASFRDRPELLFAASQILPRYDPDPGCKVATPSKNLRVGTVAAMAVAPTMPIPGMLLRRLLASSERC